MANELQGRQDAMVRKMNLTLYPLNEAGHGWPRQPARRLPRRAPRAWIDREAWRNASGV